MNFEQLTKTAIQTAASNSSLSASVAVQHPLGSVQLICHCHELMTVWYVVKRRDGANGDWDTGGSVSADFAKGFLAGMNG